MRFDEALQILGIEVSAGKKGARRAYLKLIKVHKPDRDPEMFRRIREAYERVDAEIEFQARFFRPATPAPAPEPPPAILTARSSALDALLERAPPPSEPPRPPEAPRIEARPSTPPRIEQRPPDPVRIETRTPEAPRIEPRAADPLLIAIADDPLLLRVHADPQVRIEPLSGPPEPEPVLHFEPPARPEVPPSVLLARALACMVDGEGKGADRLALEAFEVARRFPEAPAPAAFDAIRLTLLLFAAGRIVAARRVARAMRGWLSDTGLERSVMGGRQAANLAVIQAFIDLPADTPPRPIAIVAQATLDGALEAAHAPLRTFANDSPYSAVVAADRFRDHAPLLSSLFGDRLRGGERVVQDFLLDPKRASAQVPATRGRGCGWSILGYAAVMILIAIVGRALSGGGGSGWSPRSTTWQPPKIEIPKFRDLKPLTLPSLPPLQHMKPGQPTWHFVLCSEIDSPRCVLADTLRSAVAQGDCESAHLAEGELARIDEPLVRASLRLARLELARACPAPDTLRPSSEESK